MDSRTGLSWESTLHRIVLKYVLSFVVLQYILARVAGDRAEKKKDAKGRRLVDRGSVYSIGFASSHRPTTHAGRWSQSTKKIGSVNFSFSHLHNFSFECSFTVFSK